MNQPVKPILWLWLPLIWLAFQLAIEITLTPHTLAIIHSENGPHELVQFFVMAVAFGVACRVLMTMDRGANRWMTAWIVIAAICSFYVAGEEMSWGQTVMHWATPSEWATLNDQDETNLHNTSSWLDQKPRALLEIGTMVGGLLIPLLRRVKSQWLPARFTAIYPADNVVITAAIYAAIKLVEGVARHFFHVRLFERSSEVEELYMYWFVLLYLLDMKARLARPAGA
jgi:hypothetical protein